MNDQAIKFRFGIFVLASLILLGVLVMLFGGLPRYFAQNDAYTIVVDNAQGVTPGTPVRRSGVKIGEVRDVKLNDATGKVELPILVERGRTIQKGDRPTIVRGLLGGDATLDFLPPEDPQKADAAAVPPGSQLIGFTPPEAPELLQKTGELLTPAREALLSLQKVLTAIDKMTPLFEETTKEFRDLARATNRMVPEVGKTNDELRELAKATRQTVPEFKKTSDEFQVTAQVWRGLGERLAVLTQVNEVKINKMVDQLEEASRRLNNVLSEENQKNLNAMLKNTRLASDKFDGIAKNTDDMLKEARAAIKNLDTLVTKSDELVVEMQRLTKLFNDNSPPILLNLQQGSTTLNQTLTDFRDLMRDLARSDGTLQKLMHDPSLYNNLNDTACMINHMLPRLDRILGDVEIFADKIARHPESLGIGGVVRPGSGLKEAPSVLPWKEMPEPRWRIWPQH
jgi:phospholipid/cholesterol/gamma-HCH transport system substrate-binding protein